MKHHYFFLTSNNAEDHGGYMLAETTQHTHYPGMRTRCRRADLWMPMAGRGDNMNWLPLK